MSTQNTVYFNSSCTFTHVLHVSACTGAIFRLVNTKWRFFIDFSYELELK